MLQLDCETESVLNGRKNEIRRLEEVFRDCEIRHGRPATNLEVCDELGLSLGEFYGLLNDCRGLGLGRFEGLDPENGNERERRHIRYLPDPEDQDQFRVFSLSRLRDALGSALDGLPKNERLVITLHHDKDLPFSEIAQMFGISLARVTQIHTTAMLRMRGKLLACECA